MPPTSWVTSSQLMMKRPLEPSNQVRMSPLPTSRSSQKTAMSGAFVESGRHSLLLEMPCPAVNRMPPRTVTLTVP